MKVDDVKRVLSQIVEASCNSFARTMAERCRQMMCDESMPPRGIHGVVGYRAREFGEESSPYYRAGRNDVLRELAKWLDRRIEQSLIEATARDISALVGANGHA